MKKQLLLILTVSLSAVAFAQTSKELKKHQFVSGLMAKLTLEEKLGQLNLPASSDFVTGAVSSSDIAEKVKAGNIFIGHPEFESRLPYLARAVFYIYAAGREHRPWILRTKRRKRFDLSYDILT